MGRVCLVKADQIAGERINGIGVVLTHQVLVQRLQCELTRAGPGRLVSGLFHAGVGQAAAGLRGAFGFGDGFSHGAPFR